MKVGFIGLGLMGAGMALNIRKAGHDMVVHDLKREAAERHIAAGAKWVDSPRAVAQASDVVFTSLPGPPEMEAVALGENGLLASMPRGSAWFDLTTNSPSLVRRLHERFAANGVALMDAPVSGGPAGANSGKLAIWIGGEKSVFDAHRKLLADFSDQAMYIGEIGAGTVTKLVHNCAGYAVNAALAEVFSVGVKAGVDPLSIFRAVRQGAGGRVRLFDRIADKFLQGNFEPPSFALRLAYKDMTLATELGRELNVPMRVCNLARDDMTEALNRGWGTRDSRTPMLLQTERAGVTIAVPREKVKDVLEKE